MMSLFQDRFAQNLLILSTAKHGGGVEFTEIRQNIDEYRPHIWALS